MSTVLFAIGCAILLGLIDANSAFGLTEDEMSYVLGLGLWLLAFVAWVVERFTEARPE